MIVVHFSFAFYGFEMYSDMMDFNNWSAYTVCCFATGYFIYDTVDIVLAKRALEKWEIMLHHFVVGPILIIQSTIFMWF